MIMRQFNRSSSKIHKMDLSTFSTPISANTLTSYNCHYVNLYTNLFIYYYVNIFKQKDIPPIILQQLAEFFSTYVVNF